MPAKSESVYSKPLSGKEQTRLKTVGDIPPFIWCETANQEEKEEEKGEEEVVGYWKTRRVGLQQSVCVLHPFFQKKKESFKESAKYFKETRSNEATATCANPRLLACGGEWMGWKRLINNESGVIIRRPND